MLRGVDFTAAEGTATALLGPSGSGKTTVLRSLNVLETPDTGTVRIADAAVDFGAAHDKATRRREVKALRARSGMVFQSHNLFPHKTVLGNLVEGPGAGAGRDRTTRRRRTRADCSTRSASPAARTPTRLSSPADSSSGSASPARWP